MNSLLGAARAARAGGDPAGATTHYKALLEGAADATRAFAVDEARDYLSGPPPMEVLEGAGPVTVPRLDGNAALDYLRGLRGRWEVQGGDEGPFGWEFDVTSRGGVVVERLKVGTSTEMATVYHLDEGTLVASHYCQLGNQPRLTAVSSEAEGDLHFLCDGDVGGTGSHAELHMHGVHFQKKDEGLLIWMDMLENDEVAFQTSYELVRVD